MTDNGFVHSDETEKAVLSVLLQQNDYFFAFASRLKPKIFHNHKYQRIFAAIKAVIDRGDVADMLSVTMQLAKHGDTQVSAMDVMEVVSDYVSDTTFSQNVAILEEMSRRRDGWILGQKLIKAAEDMTIDLTKVGKEMNDFLTQDDGGDDGVVTMTVANNRLRETIGRNITTPGGTGIKTGFSFIDEKGGFQLGDFVVIAADSSMGKTTLGINIAVNAAIEKHPVMVYSMEMQAHELSARINAAQSGISSGVMMFRTLRSDQQHDIEDAMKKTSTLPIYFDEKNSNTAESILLGIRQAVRKYGIKLVIIDYLQILSTTENVQSEEHFFGTVSRRLKNTAMEEKICVIALSQLNRNWKEPRPTLGRLRASGQIGEAADNVLFIYRPSEYGKSIDKMSVEESRDYAELILAKGRKIGTGTSVVGFDRDRSLFYDKVPPSESGGGSVGNGTPQPPVRNEFGIVTEEGLPF